MGSSKKLACFIVSATLTLLSPLPSYSQQLDCKSIESVEVAGREFIQQGSNYQQVKNSVINSVLQQAVEQVLGKQITANSRSELKVRNEELEESLRTLNVERARGFISSYKIAPPGEELIQQGGMNLMQLTVIADVCIPEYRGASYVVAVGEFKDRAGTIQSLVPDIVVASITSNTKFAAIRLPVSSDTYYDYVISGQVTNVRENKVPNLGGELTSKLFEKITNKRQRIDDEVVQVTVDIALQLEDVSDKSVKSAIGSGVSTMPIRATPNEKDTAVIKATEAAVQGALKKLKKLY